MKVTTRVDTKELADISWSLGDIAAQLGKSNNSRVKAAIKVLREIPMRLTKAVSLDNGAKRPTVVCLCGSTRFWKQFQEASLSETLAGRIVLSVGAAVASDDEHFGHLSAEEQKAIKEKLDELHLRKIDLADEVYILNLGGYIGESTSRELAYALSFGKPVRYLEPIEERPNDEEIKEAVEAHYTTAEGEQQLLEEEAAFAAGE